MAGYSTTSTHDAGMSSDDNIVEVAAKAGSVGTLLAAAEAAGLVGALEGEGPLTVFAPTDDAFAKLPAGTVETLLKPENKEQLKAILLYHVVAGDVTSDKVVKLSSAETLQGQKVKIAVKDGKVYVDDAQVIKADVDASNGVIHVIDSVILPSD
ncbi:MAG: fasciclin domain-containing protein [Gemmatimonadota bacterium]